NWDFLAIGLSTLGIYAWSRKRPGVAGVLLGLGIAAKLYPLFFFWPLLLLCIRTGKIKQFAVSLSAAVATWLIVNGPVRLAAPDAWWEFFRNSRERGLDWGTLWYIGKYFRFTKNGQP